jgi:hypothetical protein
MLAGNLIRPRRSSCSGDPARGVLAKRKSRFIGELIIEDLVNGFGCQVSAQPLAIGGGQFDRQKILSFFQDYTRKNWPLRGSQQRMNIEPSRGEL